MNDLPPPAAARYDIFEPDDKTALVCMDVPEMERIVVEQLSGIGYKVHTGISVEDLHYRICAHPYDIILIAENFGASDIGHNPLLSEIVAGPALQRHHQLVVVVGTSMKTSDEMQAFRLSVDLVIGRADITNISPVIRRAAQRHQAFYGRYLDAITAADVA